MSVVLFREDTSLEDNLISLLRDLYDFQEPYKDSIPWLYFVERLERFLEMSCTSSERLYLQSLITLFRLHHMVNYQLISSAVFRFHQWLNDYKDNPKLSTPDSFLFHSSCHVTWSRLIPDLVVALMDRLAFFGEHRIGYVSESLGRNLFVRQSEKDSFYLYTLSQFLKGFPSIVLSIWFDEYTLSNATNLYGLDDWDSILVDWEALESRTTSKNSFERSKKGIYQWKPIWIKPDTFATWLESYHSCIVSFILEIHRHGRLGHVLKAKDPKSNAHYWICCMNWLYTVVLMMPSEAMNEQVGFNTILQQWMKQFCWSIQRIPFPKHTN